MGLTIIFTCFSLSTIASSSLSVASLAESFPSLITSTQQSLLQAEHLCYLCGGGSGTEDEVLN